MDRFNLLGGQSDLLGGRAHPVNLLFTSLPQIKQEDAIYKPKSVPGKQVGQRQSSKQGFKGHKSSKDMAKAYIPPAHVRIKTPEKHSGLDIFKSKVLLVNALIIGYCW